MKSGLLYILFLFLALLTVSLHDTGNNQLNNDNQTCQSLTTNPGVSCIVPESITSLKKVPWGQTHSDIFHSDLLESLNPDRIKIHAQTLSDLIRPVAYLALGQRVLLFLIFNNSSQDDPHLWNK